MTIIQLNIPSNCSQYGLFVESDNPWDKSQDMIDISSGNILIYGILGSIGAIISFYLAFKYGKSK